PVKPRTDKCCRHDYEQRLPQRSFWLTEDEGEGCALFFFHDQLSVEALDFLHPSVRKVADEIRELSPAVLAIFAQNNHLSLSFHNAPCMLVVFTAHSIRDWRIPAAKTMNCVIEGMTVARVTVRAAGHFDFFA